MDKSEELEIALKNLIALKFKYERKLDIERDPIEVVKLESQIIALDERISHRKEQIEGGFQKNQKAQEYKNADITNRFADILEGMSSIETSFENIYILRKFIGEEILPQLDSAIFKSKDKRSLFIEKLFEEIFESTIISTTTQNDILKVKDSSVVPWFNKCQIIGVLAACLMNSRQFDYKKAELLTAFVFDEDRRIWIRALIGLLLGLYNHDKRLQRYGVIVKLLKTFKENNEIQKKIDFLDMFLSSHPESYMTETNFPFNEVHFFRKKMNWFLPYTLENEGLIEFISETTCHNVDELQFLTNLNKLPIPNQFKHYLALRLTDRTPFSKKETELIDLLNYEFPDIDLGIDMLVWAEVYSYSSFQDYYDFRYDTQIFESPIKINKPGLRKYIISTSTSKKVFAFSLLKEKKYEEAIDAFQDYISIRRSDSEAIRGLQDSYLGNEDFYGFCNSMINNLTDNELFKNNKFKMISLSYYLAKDYGLCTRYVDMIDTVNSVNLFQYNRIKSLLYFLDTAWQQAVLHCISSLSNNKRDFHLLNMLGHSYLMLKEYEKAIAIYSQVTRDYFYMIREQKSPFQVNARPLEPVCNRVEIRNEDLFYLQTNLNLMAAVEWDVFQNIEIYRGPLGLVCSYFLVRDLESLIETVRSYEKWTKKSIVFSDLLNSLIDLLEELDIYNEYEDNLDQVISILS